MNDKFIDDAIAYKEAEIAILKLHKIINEICKSIERLNKNVKG